jgi:hypothetical protein
VRIAVEEVVEHGHQHHALCYRRLENKVPLWTKKSKKPTVWMPVHGRKSEAPLAPHPRGFPAEHNMHSPQTMLTGCRTNLVSRQSTGHAVSRARRRRGR